jgi:phosphatidylglycerophosphatase A
MSRELDAMVLKTAARGRRAVWLATGLGVGLAVPAPGTVGGAWGLLLAGLLANWLSQPAAVLAVVAVLAVAAALLCDRAATELGGPADPPAIVLDEIVATPLIYWLTGMGSWTAIAAGWLLFRLFDVWKPGPVRQAERLSGGWGIVADDLVAALLASVVLWGGLSAAALAGIRAG